uniref:RRM domain-containing protein n=1 Tax=Aureoumbra lagunensis TaxID=44058 RepID=A0A7S3K5J2_9STRA|mmetsp:Transcript_23225/g.30076  ORF Transcript_23225/g.30076 Transcript_23225/m.30076 type:complete len:202 (+) Transcript_23225:76-681(+)
MSTVDLSLDDLIKMRQSKDGQKGKSVSRQQTTTKNRVRASPKDKKLDGSEGRRRTVDASRQKRRGQAQSARRGMEIDQEMNTGGAGNSSSRTKKKTSTTTTIFERLGPRQGQIDPAKSIFVSNIPYDVLEKELRQLFGSIGRVVDVIVEYDNSGRSKGKATIQMDNSKNALRAIETYNENTIDGRTLRITLLAEKQQRQQQ